MEKTERKRIKNRQNYILFLWQNASKFLTETTGRKALFTSAKRVETTFVKAVRCGGNTSALTASEGYLE